MKSIVRVFKIGGKVINDPTLMTSFLNGVNRINGHKVIVHGGGNKASEVMQAMGLKPKMLDGRRITDAATLEIVTMVYGGLINKRIVAHLQANNVNAIGLSGADGNILKAHKREISEVDYGYVGDIDRVNGNAIMQLCENGYTPVICALSHDGNGQILNTNADTIASKVAVELSSLSEVHLIFCFELNGVLSDYKDKNSVISTLSKPKMNELHKEGIINDGMIPKLDNGFDALEGGVNLVAVRNINEMNIDKAGTILNL